MSDYEGAGPRGEPVPVSPMKREDSMALSQLSENHGRYNETTLSREGLSDRETSYSYGGYSPAATPTHSYSTARSDGQSLGRDGTTPRKKGKTMSLKVQMLDDSVLTVDVVCHHLPTHVRFMQQRQRDLYDFSSEPEATLIFLQL